MDQMQDKVSDSDNSNHISKQEPNVLENIDNKLIINHNLYEKKISNRQACRQTCITNVVSSLNLISAIYQIYKKNIDSTLQILLKSRSNKNTILFTNTKIPFEPIIDKFNHVTDKISRDTENSILVKFIYSYQPSSNTSSNTSNTISNTIPNNSDIDVERSVLKEYILFSHPISKIHKLFDDHSLYIDVDRCPLGEAKMIIEERDCHDACVRILDVNEVIILPNPVDPSGPTYCTGANIAKGTSIDTINYLSTSKINIADVEIDLCLDDMMLIKFTLNLINKISVESRTDPLTIVNKLTEYLSNTILPVSADNSADTKAKLSNKNISKICVSDLIHQNYKIKKLINELVDPVLNHTSITSNNIFDKLSSIAKHKIDKILKSDKHHDIKKHNVKEIILNNLRDTKITTIVMCSVLNILMIPARICVSEPKDNRKDNDMDRCKSTNLIRHSKNFNEVSQGREISHFWIEFWMSRTDLNFPFISWLKHNGLMKDFEEHVCGLDAMVCGCDKIEDTVDPDDLDNLKRIFDEWSDNLNSEQVDDLKTFNHNMNDLISRYSCHGWQMVDLDTIFEYPLENVIIAPIELIKNEKLLIRSEDLCREFNITNKKKEMYMTTKNIKKIDTYLLKLVKNDRHKLDKLYNELFVSEKYADVDVIKLSTLVVSMLIRLYRIIDPQNNNRGSVIKCLIDDIDIKQIKIKFDRILDDITSEYDTKTKKIMKSASELIYLIINECSIKDTDTIKVRSMKQHIHDQHIYKVSDLINYMLKIYEIERSRVYSILIDSLEIEEASIDKNIDNRCLIENSRDLLEPSIREIVDHVNNDDTIDLIGYMGYERLRDCVKGFLIHREIKLLPNSYKLCTITRLEPYFNNVKTYQFHGQ